MNAFDLLWTLLLVAGLVWFWFALKQIAPLFEDDEDL